MPKLTLRSTPEDYYNWRDEKLSDPEVYQADINDGQLIWGVCRVIYNNHPELREKVEEEAEACIEQAFSTLGLFMGLMNLCTRIGLDYKIGEQYLLDLFGTTIPELKDE